MKTAKIILAVVMISLIFLAGCDLIAGLFGSDETNQVSAPIFAPQPEDFTPEQNITIACATSGVRIYYTTDGSPPTIASTLYSGPFQITENTFLKAFATKSGMHDSEITSGYFHVGAGEGTIIGMLFTEDGLGDQGYNDAAYSGLLAASNQFDVAVTSATSGGNNTNGLRNLADEGAELVFGVGYQMAEDIPAAASSRPDAVFAGIDLTVDSTTSPDNAIGITFKEHEAGYLAGIVAGYLTYEYADVSEKLNEQNIVGMVKGMDIDPVERFAAGFYAGVKIVNPECTILSRTSNSFSDYAQGKADAQEMIDLGADIIFNIAGYTGVGAMEAADESGVLAIGVDVDQNYLFPNTVITSALKDIEKAVLYITGQHLAGILAGGENIVLGLDEDSVGIAPFHSFDTMIPDEVKTSINQATVAIKAGDLPVPEFMDDMLNIGVAGPFTGSLSNYGIPTLNAINILAMQINQDGGVLDKFVNIIEGDDQCNVDLADDTAQALVDAGVVGVIGHICSGSTENALAVYEPLDIPAISPSSTSTPLTQSGNFPNFFRTIPPNDAQSMVLVDFAVETLGVSSFALIHNINAAATITAAQEASDYITALSGINTVFEEGIDFSTDYSSSITTLGSSGAEAVLFIGAYTGTAEFLIALRDASINLPFLTFDSAKSSAFVDLIGANPADVYVAGQIDVADIPEAADFVTTYNEMFGTDPGPFAVNAYAAGAALFAAILDANSTTGTDIIASLNNGQFDTCLGTIEFDSNGDVTGAASEYLVYTVEDGAFTEYTEPITGPGSSESDPLIIGAVPQSDATAFAANMDSLIDLLEAESGLFFDKYIGTNYDDLLTAAAADPVGAHITFLPTFSYITAAEDDLMEAAFIAERYGSLSYNGQIIAGSESGITSIADLDGKTFSRPDPLSTSGWIIPLLMMYDGGIDPYSDLAGITTAGGHAETVADVYSGTSAAGATYVDARSNITTVAGYENVTDVMDKVLVIATSTPIPNDGIQLLSSLADNTKTVVIDAFEAVADTTEGDGVIESFFSWDTIVAEDDSFYDEFRALLTGAGLTLDELFALIDNEGQ